jgi:biotin carboxyl carrier protein
MVENRNMKKKSPPKIEIKNACESLGLDCRTLKIGETNYFTLFTKKFENRKAYKPADPKKIHSYIPGTILKILVKEGKQMKIGEPILILEAMKMRNIVTIPVSGKLKTIYVKEGETIPKDFLIAEVE